MDDLILLEPHEAELRALLYRETGAEAAAYVIFGQSAIAADPGQARHEHALCPMPSAQSPKRIKCPPRRSMLHGQRGG